MIRNLQSMITIIKQVWEILSAKQRRQCGGVFLLIFFSSFLELLGVSAIIPFVSALLDIEQFRQNKFVAPILDILNVQSTYATILCVGLCLVIVYLLKNVMLLISSYVQIDFRCKMQENLSIQMFKSYMKRPYTFFLNINSAEILRGIGADVGGVFFVLDDIFNLLSQMMTFIMIGAFLIAMDWKMALGILFIAVICIGIITFFMKSKMQSAGKSFREADVHKTKIAVEAVNGIKEISVMRRRRFFAEQYEKAYDQLRKSDQQKCFLTRVPERIIETLFICGIILIVCVRARNMEQMNSLIMVLSAFALAAIRILPSISGISNSFNDLSYQKTSLAHAYENIMKARKMQDMGQAFLEEQTDDDVKHFCQTLELKAVSWKYDGTNKNVLEDINLTIRKGESVALIGESGAGKTTLADTILGLLAPQEGTVLIDGVDISSIPQSWSKMIGYVPQSVYLIDDSIRANVALGIQKEDCDEKSIWNALEQAQLKKFVEDLPNGLDTIVGERGVKFSGGQRQRIAIARALYYNPQILVLDEATSALDNETEEAVMEAIDALQGKKTLIIVAHRLSTIRNCDKIYEIKDGKAILRDKADVIKEG